MKLLTCTVCRDTIALTHWEERRCHCGQTRGRYWEDGHNANITGPCIIVGVHSRDLAILARRYLEGLPITDDIEVEAFAIPESARTIHRPVSEFCGVCKGLQNDGQHDTFEVCDMTRGPCLDPGRHHPYQPEYEFSVA